MLIINITIIRREGNYMTEDRREKIISLLRENGEISLRELEELFSDVSSMTLRRDLAYFESLGDVVRIKGGAKYLRGYERSEDNFELRKIINKTAKDQIAEIAALYADTGRSIFIDSGTTAMCLAKKLPDTNLSVFTSGPNVAVELSKKISPSISLTGGLLNRANLSVSGPQAIQFIDELNIDTAFLAASAYSSEAGFTCGNFNECELKKRIVKKSKKIILLIDSSKFNKSMPFTFAGMDEIDLMITEKCPEADILNSGKLCNVEIRWN